MGHFHWREMTLQSEGDFQFSVGHIYSFTNTKIYERHAYFKVPGEEASCRSQMTPKLWLGMSETIMR